MKLLIESWEESERGWGIRPDGYAVHRSMADRAAYVKAYWETMPDRAPGEYSRPAGVPGEVEVDDGSPLAVAMRDRPSLRVYEQNALYEEVSRLFTVSEGKGWKDAAK